MPTILKAIGYAACASITGPLIVLLVAMCLFGFRHAEWAEWQGVIVGLVGTITGIAGAVVGLQIVLRPVDSCGGAVDVDSVDDLVTFTVTVPTIGPAEGEADADLESAAAGARHQPNG